MNQRLEQFKGILAFCAAAAKVIFGLLIVLSLIGIFVPMFFSFIFLLVYLSVFFAILWVVYKFAQFLIEWADNTYQMNQKLSMLNPELFSKPVTITPLPAEGNAGQQSAGNGDSPNETDLTKPVPFFEALNLLKNNPAVKAIENDQFIIQLTGEGERLIAEKTGSSNNLLFETLNLMQASKLIKTDWTICDPVI